jgi:hypothetical protein
MIYLYGDSHAQFSFNGLELQNKNYYESSITMFRVGRDNTIVNFNIHELTQNDIIVLVYGEVDCRCHIKRQIDLGKYEDDVIYELVDNYFKTIQNSGLNNNLKIIIVGVIPPTNQSEYERINEPIWHEFPFVGSDEERVRFTQKVNILLEEMSNKHNYNYFNPYSYYTREDGTFKHQYSDTTVHLKDNSVFLEKFTELCNRIQN